MNRQQLEHAIRASGAISGDRELYVVGSQSILGPCPQAHPDLCRSMEVDIAPKNRPELEILIEGSIGELSPFHQTFGFYVDGVEIGGIALPAGWQDRLVPVDNPNTNGYCGLCLSPSDLAASKLVAARSKDLDFVRVMLREHIISADELQLRLTELPDVTAAHQTKLLERLRSISENH